MAIPGTTVVAARVAIYTAINATALVLGDPTIKVMYDQPGPGGVLADDIISVGAVRQSEEPYAVVGSGAQGWMKEDYTVEVICTAFRAGDEADVAFARCAALVDAVRTAVRLDPSLGGAVVTAYPSDWDYQPSWDEKGLGRYCVATGHVSCTVQS